MYDKINPLIYALLATLGLVVGNLIIRRVLVPMEVVAVFVLSSAIFYFDHWRATTK